MLYVADRPSNRNKNHNRRCANDNGANPSHTTGPNTGRTPPEPPANTPAAPTPSPPPGPNPPPPPPDPPAPPPANPAGVDASNTRRTGTSTPNTERTRDTRRVANNECPPNTKKSSSTPTRGNPKTSAN